MVMWLPKRTDKSNTQTSIDVDQLIVEGSVTGNRDAILHALTIHPMVRSGKVVDTIITEMIKINKEYLPQFK